MVRAWQTSAIQSLWWGLGLNLLWIPAFAHSAQLGVIVLGAMIALGSISYAQLKDQDLVTESYFMIVYLTWLSFALSLNLYIASKCLQ